MTDVLVTPAFVSLVPDTGEASKFGPSAWNAARLFSGGNAGDQIVRDLASATGASWVTPAAVLTPAKGGTGLASYAVGDLLYASGATALSQLADVTAGSVLVSGGVGVAPAWSASPTLTKVLFGDGLVGTPGAAFASQPNTGFYRPQASFIGVAVNGTFTMGFDASFHLSSVGLLAWTSGAPNGVNDLLIARDAANTLAQRNGANAQALRIYNTFTDAANYERANFAWSANVFNVTVGALGTGASRSLVLGTDATSSGNVTFQTTGVNRWQVAGGGSPGHMLAALDNTYDIGASGATRPRTGYFGTSLVVGATPASAGAICLPNAAVINFRNAANSGDLALLWTNSSNQILIGNGTSDILWFKPLVALGGGVAPTLGTIGGSGPATAAQNAWMRVIDSTGAAFFVPAWK